MHRSIRTLLIVAALATAAAGPPEDPDMMAVFPTGEPPAAKQVAPDKAARPAAGSEQLHVGDTVYPRTSHAISCMDPGVLFSVWRQVRADPDQEGLEEHLEGDGCALNDGWLPWQVVGDFGDRIQVQLIAGPTLVMWFMRQDLSRRQTVPDPSSPAP